MLDLGITAIIYWGVIVGLIVVFFVSLAIFIRRLQINSFIKNNQATEIQKKLDKIIELLEKEKSS